MKLSEFLRLYQFRASNIMWFLGAGASRAAKIPTGFDMIWDFKRMLYCSEEGVSPRTISDLSLPGIRNMLQSYFDSKGNFPPENSEDEYAEFFERAIPDEGDRRSYIDACVTNAKPSFGHHVLAGLMKSDKARFVWTTNFDRTVEDSANLAFGSSTKLVTSTIDNASTAMQAMNGGRWPLLVKLHGDFQSTNLKNTTNELQGQDAELRHALIEACQRFGLAVIGYSGRDESIMDALDQAVKDSKSYPSGIFWFVRSDGYQMPRVQQLIDKANASGVKANIVEVETFDELFSDIFTNLPDLPDEIVNSLTPRTSRLSDAPVPVKGGGWPVIRMNALPIDSSPGVCRLIDCTIGGTREVRQAVIDSGANLIVGRRSGGVIAFGSDDQVRLSFNKFNIKRFDVHPIEVSRLKFDSPELGLLYDALARSMERHLPVKVKHPRGKWVAYVDCAHKDADCWKNLRRAAGSICGMVPKSSLQWYEGIRIGLEFYLDRLWLLMEPTVGIDRADGDVEYALGKEFVRAKSAKRYNDKWNAILDGWIDAIVGPDDSIRLSAFGISDGVDASFLIRRRTAYSRRSNTNA